MASRSELHADRTRAESFGGAAGDYDRYRPTYPDELLDDLAALSPAGVLDVACGTGRVAVALAARGLDVLGIEPDARMAAVARSHGLTVEVATFEDWADAGRRVDLITCGQAWHWIDPVAGAARAATVLRPGGTLARFWNRSTLAADAQQRLDEVYERCAPQLTASVANSRTPGTPPSDAVAESPDFTDVGERTHTWQRDYTAEEWVGMVATHSDHLTLPSSERTALLQGLHDAITDLGGLSADYRTWVVLARRR